MALSLDLYVLLEGSRYLQSQEHQHSCGNRQVGLNRYCHLVVEFVGDRQLSEESGRAPCSITCATILTTIVKIDIGYTKYNEPQESEDSCDFDEREVEH